MKPMMLLLVVVALASSCATGRTEYVPHDATTELRAKFAGKTVECAGEARTNALWASIGGAVVSVASSATAAYATTQARTDPNLSGGLSLAAGALSVAAFGLEVYALVTDLNAAELSERAGRVLADQGNDACVDGTLPK